MTDVGTQLGVPIFSMALLDATATSANSILLSSDIHLTAGVSAIAGIEWGTGGIFTHTSSTPILANVPIAVSTVASGLPVGAVVNYRAVLKVDGTIINGSTKSITIPGPSAVHSTVATDQKQVEFVGADLAPRISLVNSRNFSSTSAVVFWPNMPKPIPVEPANGYSNAAERPVFSWSAVTNATSYRLLIARNASDLPVDPTVSDCGNCLVNTIIYGNSVMLDANELDAGQSYSWRVKARSPNQYGELSDIWQFSLPAQALLPSPTSTLPHDGGNLDAVAPVLVWQSVPGATSYRIFIAKDAVALALQPSDGACANCIINTTTTDTQFALDPTDFAPGTSYYWIVKGRNAAQYGSYSNLSRFFVSQSQCNFSFASSSLAPSALGGTYALTLMTQPGCSAATSTNQSYCTASPSPVTADSSGQAGLNLTISPNGATARSCTVTVGNGTLSVSQPANAPVSTWNFTLNQATGGTAWVSPNQTVFADGVTVNLSASPSFGYAFAGWLDSGTIVSSGANFAFPIHSSRTLTPSFSSTQVTVTGSISPSVTPDQKWRVLGTGINSMTTWQTSGQTISLQSGTSYRVDCADTPYYQPSANTFNFTPGSSFSCNYSAKAQQVFSPSLTLRPQPRLASGQLNSLARLDDGRTLVWGFWQYMDFPNYSANSPQKGTPTLLRPLFLPYSDDVLGVNISSGQLIGMATLSNTGTWKSWGNAANSAVRVPTVDSSLNGFVRMSGTLGLKADGSLWFVNQTGSNTPVATVADIVDIAGTYRSSQTIALRKDGAVISLTYDGDTSNCYTQGIFYLPNGPYQNCTIPVAIPSINRVVSIAASTRNAYAVKEDGTVWVWGANNVTGGAVRPANDNRPIQVPGIADAAQVVAGVGVAYVRTKGGAVYAWGDNNVGQLGRGTVSASEINSQAIAGLSNIVELGQTDGKSLLALDGNGFVWTVGVAMSVGNGTSVTTQSTPVKVSCPNGYVGDLNLTSFASSCIPAATNTLSIADRTSAGGKQVLIDGVPVTLPFSQNYPANTQVTVEIVPDIGLGFGGLIGDLGEFSSRIRTLLLNRDWNLLLDTYNCASYPGNSATIVNGSSMVPVAVPATGGPQTVNVLTTSGSIDRCHWGFYTADSWIQASGDGFGPSSLVLNVEPNPSSAPRIGNFKVGGSGGGNIQVTQAAAPVDTAPDLFSFPSYIGAPGSTLIQSAAITLSGVNTTASISVANGEYSIGCNGTFTTLAGTISNTQTVCVRQTSSSLPMTSTTTTLGVGGVSGPFVVTTQAVAPSQPTNVSATAGNAQATVTFTTPGSTGGVAITGYAVTSNPAGGTDSNAGTLGLSHIITGLTNGTAYTFTVTATNGAGATSVPSAQSNTVTPKGSQTIGLISFSPNSLTVGGTTTASATATSALVVTFSSTTPSVCTVSGNTVTGIAAGACAIAADQGGNSSYTAATQVTQSFTVNALIAQTIAFTNPGAKTLGAAPFALSANGGASGNVVTFASQTTGVCTVSGSTVTLVATGTCTIAADQGGTATYAAASQVLQSFTVSKASQSIGAISFTPISLTIGGNTTVSATATSSLGVTFTSVTPTTCSVSSNTVTGLVAGTCTVAADQGGNGTYSAAPQVTQNITVNKVSQTIGAISFSPTSVAVGGTTTASAAASSGLGVTFISMTLGICTVNGSTVTGIAAGTCTIAVDQAGNSTYGAAPQVTQNLGVGKVSQTIGVISFTPNTLTVGGTTTASATASSGLGVTFSSTTQSTCTVSGSTVTSVAAGTCTIAVDQSGNSTYAAATQLTQNITVNKVSQTIGAIGFNPTSLTVGGNTTASATATSGLTVTFSSSTQGTCTISGSTVTGIAAGTCTMAADQAGNNTYGAAPQITQSIAVNALTPQTITFANPGAKTLGSAPFALSATGGASGNPVTFASLTTGVCTVSGSTVTLVAAGTCTIAADQAGNGAYVAASQVLQSFAVNALIAQTISFTNPGANTLGSSPFALSATGGAS